jgi:hypothetical protein
MVRVILRTAAVVLLMLAFALPSARHASAEINDCTTRKNRWAGWWNQHVLNADTSGARANISVYRGSVCNTDKSQNNFTTAWVLIRSPMDIGTIPGYAQVGYFRWYNSAIYDFAEYRNMSQSNFHRFLFAGQPVGSDPNYAIYIAGDDRIYGYSDNRRLFVSPNTNFQMLDGADGKFSNLEYPLQWLSEATYAQSDIPGTPTAKTRWHHMRQGYFNQGWFTAQPDTSINSNTSRWTFTGISDSSIWDRGYLSWTYANL